MEKKTEEDVVTENESEWTPNQNRGGELLHKKTRRRTECREKKHKTKELGE